MQDNIAGAVGGAIFGTIGGIHFFLNEPIPIITGNPAVDFVWNSLAKMAGTIILATLGGLAGMASKDLYKYLKRKWDGKVK